MTSHKEYEISYVVCDISIPGRPAYMALGGDGHDCYIDHCTPEKAEKFDTAKEARDWLRKDPEARQWKEQHPKARVLKMRSGFTVYAPR